MQPFKYNPNNNSGSYRHRVEIQKPVKEVDGLGQIKIIGWETHKTVWCMIKTLQGREYFDAAATRSERVSRFVTRYTTGIDDSMRLMYQGRSFEITTPPINDDELNKTLTIIATGKGDS